MQEDFTSFLKSNWEMFSVLVGTTLLLSTANLDLASSNSLANFMVIALLGELLIAWIFILANTSKELFSY